MYQICENGQKCLMWDCSRRILNSFIIAAARHTTYPGIMAILSALYVTFNRLFKSLMTRWNGSDIRFKERLVKNTEYFL
jgi:hypothetical protein